MSVFVFTPHPGPLLPHKPESPPPPEEPRDLNADAEKVREKIVAASMSLGGEPKNAPPPSSDEPNPLKRRPSRGREPAFPLGHTTSDAVQISVSYEVERSDRGGELVLTPISEKTETPASAVHAEKVASEKQDGMDSANGVSADKSQARQSDVPSSVYSQASLDLPSPLRITVPSRASGRDQPAPVITLPSNPRPTHVEVRVAGTEQQSEVKLAIQPPPYHSPPSPRSAPAVFDQTLVAAVRNATSSPSPSPDNSDVTTLTGPKSRFAKEQDRWMKRVVRESRSLVSRRTIPVPWLPQRPDGEPQSPDSFMDAEAAAIERSLSEQSNSNPESPNPNPNQKRKVRFATQGATLPSNEWYVGLLQAAGLGARVSSRNGSKTQINVQPEPEPEPEVPHSAPAGRSPASNVATAWRPYTNAFRAAGASTGAAAPTSPQSATSDTTLHSAEPMAAAWRPYTETYAQADTQKDVVETFETVVAVETVEAVPQPSVIVTEVDVADGPDSALDDEVLVAQKARRPEVPAQNVRLNAVQAKVEQDLDAVLKKWGAKKRDSSLPVLTGSREGTPRRASGLAECTGNYGLEAAWSVRAVPEEEGVWECEERILDSYLDRSRDSLPRVGVTA